ncbi:MAG: DEAD/DEAH box helicase family protein, partial [Deltaproteobacteria bacterium]|nr:DEAD/DEAH box helicase family protein [Deltaproteobacteria bacterium]
MFARIVLNIPSDTCFTYAVPEQFASRVTVGVRVLVPFGKRRITGYVVEVTGMGDREDIKDIIDVPDGDPLFSKRDLAFYRWTADYYMYPLGKTLKSILPGGINMESSRWLRMSGDRNAHEQIILSPGQREIVETVSLHPGGITIKKLQRKVKRIGVYEDIRKLTARGIITAEDRLGTPDVRKKTQNIISLTGKGDDRRPLTEKQRMIIRLLQDHGDLSLSSLNETIAHATAAVRRLEKREIVTVQPQEVFRNPGEVSFLGAHGKPEKLTDEQAAVLGKIKYGLSSRRYAPYLLHGVTGSGKTEVYFCAIEEVLQSGGSVLLLVPEIALTPQLLSRIQERFDRNETAILHSGITKGEKFDEWRRIMNGAARIVIGVRSAVFAPIRGLRLVIVDEEHDPSYKQDDRMPYNGRNLAIVKAKLNDAVVILGSATPAIQTTFNARERDFTCLNLTRRVDDRPLPHVDVVDMKNERDEKGMASILSRP